MSEEPFVNPWDLTTQQCRIVALLYELDSSKAIAQRLGLSESTVKGHLTEIFKRMGVTSRVGAAVKWELVYRDHEQGLYRHVSNEISRNTASAQATSDV